MWWRFRVALILIAVVTVSLVFGARSLAPKSQWQDIAGSNAFSLVRWEFENLFDKWEYKARQLVGSEPQESGVALVQRYFLLEESIRTVTAQIEKELALDEDPGTLRELENQLAALKSERDDLRPGVEETIEAQVSSVLTGLGLGHEIRLNGGAGLVFPPVDCALQDAPSLLIVSPRDRIDLASTILLKPDLKLETVLDMEAKVSDEGYSGLVEAIGGVATYPSLVPPPNSIQGLLSTVAHEWFHQYFFFRPLGRNYWASYEMTTVNETAADIAGNEVGKLVYELHYRYEPEQAQGGNTSQEAFDFGREMREIRKAVDQYLAAGQVEEAEGYMEAKRQFLAENGVYIRKLNQAYFAFHGTYADWPGSVSPIGGQLRKLREESSTFGAFIVTISSISTYDQLLKLVGE